MAKLGKLQTVRAVSYTHLDVYKRQLNAAGAVIQRAKFSRDTLMAFFDAAPKVLIGMEACPGSQWLARRLAAMGHDARTIPARFVKPYV